jgi:hypothetical protein
MITMLVLISVQSIIDIFKKKIRLVYGFPFDRCLGRMKPLKTFVLFYAAILISAFSFSQNVTNQKLEKMPVVLETAFALSALPPHLREAATVYLLDPEKGYYVARQGTNGFSTFVNRTDWEWAEFVNDSYAAISYDAEGSKTYLPVFFAVAEMRASGKYSPGEIRDTILKRVKDGTYKAPSTTGVSYMLSPLLRTHVDSTSGIVNMVMPHFMFYAPRIDNSDIGGIWDGHTPYVIGSQHLLDKAHSIFNYIIIPSGEMGKAQIIEENKDLLNQLAAYQLCLKVDLTAYNHHH